MKWNVTSGYGSGQQKYFWTLRFTGADLSCHSADLTYFSKSTWSLSLRTSILCPSYVHEPNFMTHVWESNGKYFTLILHSLRNITGASHLFLPSWNSCTRVDSLSKLPRKSIDWSALGRNEIKDLATCRTFITRLCMCNNKDSHKKN